MKDSSFRLLGIFRSGVRGSVICLRPVRYDLYAKINVIE